jgi:hypothetical protein
MYFARSCSFLIHLDGNCAVPFTTTAAVYLSIPPGERRPIHLP